MKHCVGNGLYYYGARYYDPRISLWLSVDPLTEKDISLSPYAYVANNPLKYTDPTGLWMDSTNTAEAKHLKLSVQMKRTALQIERNHLNSNKEPLGDINERINQLTKSINDFDAMLNDKKLEYKYITTTGGSYVDMNNIESTGVVNIYVQNNTEMKVHESRHGGDIARGTLNTDNYNVTHEISAYRAQYAYLGSFKYSSMPTNVIENMQFNAFGHSNIVSIKNISQINRGAINNMVEAVSTGKGYTPVRVYPPSGLSKAQWSLGFNKDAYLYRRK